VNGALLLVSAVIGEGHINSIRNTVFLEILFMTDCTTGLLNTLVDGRSNVCNYFYLIFFGHME